MIPLIRDDRKLSVQFVNLLNQKVDAVVNAAAVRIDDIGELPV